MVLAYDNSALSESQGARLLFLAYIYYTVIETTVRSDVIIAKDDGIFIEIPLHRAGKILNFNFTPLHFNNMR